MDAGTKAVLSLPPWWRGVLASVPDVVDVISSTDQDDTSSRLYWSGDSRAAGTCCFLLSPYHRQPTGAVQAGHSSACTGIHPPGLIRVCPARADESRTYAYTWVNAIGEESPPSPPSVQVIVFTTGASVVLSILSCRQPWRP